MSQFRAATVALRGPGTLAAQRGDLAMRVILKPGLLALAVENEEERTQFEAWRQTAAGHVFHFGGGSPKGGAFIDVGLREEACREPINIVYDGLELWRPISNLAETPFILAGETYASVEGFWQGLKCSEPEERQRIGALSGIAAKRAGRSLPQPESFIYGGKAFLAGGPAHRALMLQACRAKFSQNQHARAALLATGERPLTHRVRRDSRTIPEVLMADIWIRIRSFLRQREQASSDLRQG